MQSARRVVITGMGVICPLGLTTQSLWEALAGGQSGVAAFASLPGELLPTPFSAEVPVFTGDVADFGQVEGDLKKAVRKGLKVMNRECQMGVAAAFRALDDAGLKAGGIDPERAGIVFGSDYMMSEPDDFSAGMHLCADRTGSFEFDRWGDEGMRQLTPLWLLKYLPNMPACHIAIYKDLQGPNNSLTVREASSNLAIGEAFRTIARGHADMMIGGATGTRVHRMRTLHVVQQEEVATNGVAASQASRPFDRHRTGMVLGEGAGAVVLEELESARARGATILAEVVGFGSSSAADRNFVARRDLAMANAIRAALADARLSPADLGHVHAHGLSTRSCDADEAKALGEVFGTRRGEVPVVAAKSNFGNLGAAGGVVELIGSVLALNQNHLFPVLNYETPDPACSLRVVTDGATPSGDSFVNVNVTPQGQASAVVVSKPS